MNNHQSALAERDLRSRVIRLASVPSVRRTTNRQQTVTACVFIDSPEIDGSVGPLSTAQIHMEMRAVFASFLNFYESRLPSPRQINNRRLQTRLCQDGRFKLADGKTALSKMNDLQQRERR